MPPAALAGLTGRLTPRHSNWPRSLSAPLCASTTAILIGPAAALELLPAAGPVPLLAGGLLEPGALHAAAARAIVATVIAERGAEEKMPYLCLPGMTLPPCQDR